MPAAVEPRFAQRLHVRLLGELQLQRAGDSVVLPASRKTRALLAYLLVTAKRHLRSTLCSLFFEDASDPRAGLRWSLTQIRHTLGERDSKLLCADRDSVEFPAESVNTDLARFAHLTRNGIESASFEALAEASGLFRGAFLEGLDLPACYAYHEWCMAQREAASARLEQILVALVEREADKPEKVLGHARALAAHNPLNELGHIQLIRALGALGRRRDALAQYEQCCRIFERELGLAPPAGFVEARAHLDMTSDAGSNDSGVAVSMLTTNSVRGRTVPRLIGRQGEVAQLSASVKDASAGRASDVLLVTGVPGIGKSRLLDELEGQVATAGGRILRGRAFEAEMIRPFGFWIDAFRSLREGDLPRPLHTALLPLTQAGAGAALAGDRDALFDAVRSALLHLASSRPVAVLVDDLHWIEESSAALLHYAMRDLAGASVLFALTGRAGELEDNVAAQNLIAALAQAKRIRRIALGPLSDEEARALVGGAAQGPDAERIVARAQGNPFLLLELAQSQGASADSPNLLKRILETRLSRLSRGAGEMLDWASAFGCKFPADTLLAVLGGEPGVADRSLSELERHDLIRAMGDAGYEFNHDLVQQAAYSRISQPRRRLMHKSIAASMSLAMDAHPETCSVVAYHAGLAGQHELAATASIHAGEHGLRVFANHEAAEVARRGLRHAAGVPDLAARARFNMALLRIQVLAASGLQLARLRPPVPAVMTAIDDARAARQHAEVARGFYLLSVVHQDAGHLDAAQQATLQAAAATDRSDALGRARQLANSARCLVELGRDVAHARALVDEARTLAQAAGLHEIEVRWCTGLLHHWDGELELAVLEIDAAIELATAAEDRWRQCKCLGSAAMMELEGNRPKQAIARAKALKLAASQLGEGADEPLARAIDALARQMSGENSIKLDAAIEELRAAGDKSRLAGVLNLSASIQFGRKQFEVAEATAADALAMAEAMGEANESAMARATRAQVFVARGDSQRARIELQTLTLMLEAPGALNARAIRAAKAALLAAEAAVPATSGLVK